MVIIRPQLNNPKNDQRESLMTKDTKTRKQQRNDKEKKRNKEDSPLCPLQEKLLVKRMIDCLIFKYAKPPMHKNVAVKIGQESQRMKCPRRRHLGED